MARYDYKCPSCETVFEVEHPMSEHPTILCPKCGQEAQRVFSASGIHFEGHGFYNTDQRGGVGSTGSGSTSK
jgi:putative FmdB family regulatory protein